MKRAYTDEHAQAGVDAALPEIETWPNQYPDYEIEIVIPEFTSVCPKTGLPDFGKLVLRYVPDQLCLELKSYKMYLLAYRQLGIFQENVVNRVLRDVVKAANPKMATVVGDFSRAAGWEPSSPRRGSGRRAGALNVESAELIAILEEVRHRVRARNPQTSAGNPEIPLPDLLPLLHARDAAMGKVAAIGTVNPRRGGIVNALLQGWKRLLSRMLDWHVREQVEFNRKIVACVDAAIDALNDNNRALAGAGSALAGAGARIDALTGPMESLEKLVEDMRSHWAEWRFEWERKLQVNEVQFLRSVADLQSGFQHRTTMMDANYRDAVHAMHTEFTGALAASALDVQKRMWDDLERIRLEFERLIHGELRTIRQRAEIRGPVEKTAFETTPAGAAAPLLFDYGRFAERFRGTEEYVKSGQHVYLPYFQGCQSVLDIGCGRGEFLEMMRQAGISARGIDLSEESVAICRHKELAAEVADLYPYLDALPEGALDGIFCSQVVEHLPPERLPLMIKLCGAKLSRNGVIAIETPNPECLAIFATHFYLDPTHTRPVPHGLLAFYLEEFGFGAIEVRKLGPAAESMPSVNSLPPDFRDAFFGGLDYAILARKL